MPAKNKSELLDVSQREFQKLETLLLRIEAEHALKKDTDDRSIKDVVAHRAHWIDLFLGWYADGQAGKTVCFPAPGYKWSELKRYNADLRRRQSDQGWREAVVSLTEGHQKLIAFLQAHSDDALYGGPMKGADNNWTTGRWLEAAGPSHYRSAAKYIRGRLRSMA